MTREYGGLFGDNKRHRYFHFCAPFPFTSPYSLKNPFFLLIKRISRRDGREENRDPVESGARKLSSKVNAISRERFRWKSPISRIICVPHPGYTFANRFYTVVEIITQTFYVSRSGYS